MKRWIIAISLLMLIGIMGTSRRQGMVTVAPSDDPLTKPVVDSGATDAMGDMSTNVGQSPIAATISEAAVISTTVAPNVSSTAGQLLMIDHRLYPDHKLMLFDLATNEERVLFNVPQDGWLYQLDVSPDGDQVALSYAAPPANDATGTTGRQPYDRSGIYLLSLEDPAATPALLLGSRKANEHLFNPIWSPDGEHIYYVQYRRLTDTADSMLDVALHRYDLASEESKFIVQDGVWPRMSPNGEWLVYIQVDPLTTARSIYISDPDGDNARELVAASQFFDVDAPHFYIDRQEDKQWVYFSGVPHSTKVLDQDSSRTWWERLLDVQVAQAHTDHNMPADWWRISIDGGEPEQITSMRRIISYGTFDDRGERLFFTANTGVYSVNAEGYDLDRILLPNLYRFFAWMP